MSKAPKVEDLFTVAEYAQSKGVSTNTVYTWIKQGKLGVIQKGKIKMVYEFL